MGSYPVQLRRHDLMVVICLELGRQLPCLPSELSCTAECNWTRYQSLVIWSSGTNHSPPAKHPGPSPACAGGYPQRMCSNESETQVWYFRSVTVTEWPGSSAFRDPKAYIDLWLSLQRQIPSLPESQVRFNSKRWIYFVWNVYPISSFLVAWCTSSILIGGWSYHNHTSAAKINPTTDRSNTKSGWHFFSYRIWR